MKTTLHHSRRLGWIIQTRFNPAFVPVASWQLKHGANFEIQVI